MSNETSIDKRFDAITLKGELYIFAESIKNFAATDAMYKYESGGLEMYGHTQQKILTIHGMMVFDHAKLVWTALVEIHGAENVPSEKEWYQNKEYCGLE